MVTYLLQHVDGHLFFETGDSEFLLDTGAPQSFGRTGTTSIGNLEFDLPDDYMGLNADELGRLVGKEVDGLIGADVLNQFDCLIDVPNNSLLVSSDAIEFEGEEIPIEEFMSIPVVEVEILGQKRKMFFDTGAQLSYWQDDAIEQFPCVGTIRDFYPGAGEFETDTFEVPLKLGSQSLKLRAGRLPKLLGMTLLMADCEGIVGNECLLKRVVAYIPRRKRLILG